VSDGTGSIYWRGETCRNLDADTGVPLLGLRLSTMRAEANGATVSSGRPR